MPSTPVTDEDCARHEAAHALASLKLGLGVERVLLYECRRTRDIVPDARAEYPEGYQDEVRFRFDRLYRPAWKIERRQNTIYWIPCLRSRRQWSLAFFAYLTVLLAGPVADGRGWDDDQNFSDGRATDGAKAFWLQDLLHPPFSHREGVLDLAEKRARQLLACHSRAWAELTARLLEHECLPGAMVEQIVRAAEER